MSSTKHVNPTVMYGRSEAQLLAFRGGLRANSAQMTAIAQRMSDGEIKAVADYIAGLK